MKLIRYILLALLIFLFSFQIFGERKENIDFFLVVDKSLSMIEELDAVKSYINNSIIEKELIPGDTLTVIAFYGSADKVISFEKFELNKKSELENKINNLYPNEKWTDIGNALDTLSSILENNEDSTRRKYMLLITDGKQEAPPTSKYFSPNGKFNHKFLEKAKTIQMEGWKIQILGIGQNTVNKDLAEEFSGSYTEVSENPTEQELTDKTKNFTGIIDLISKPTISAISKNGESKLKITLKSKYYKDPTAITISDIELTVNDQNQENILENKFPFILQPDQTTDIIIPVKINMNLDPGKYNGQLSFVFQGDASFVPAVSNVNFKVKGFVHSNIYWMIPLAILILILIIYLVALLFRSSISSTRFSVITDGGATLNKTHFKLKHDKNLFITDSDKGFDLVEKKPNFVIARIIAFKKGIRLIAIESRRIFNSDKLPKNILNESCQIKDKNDNFVTLKFKS